MVSKPLSIWFDKIGRFIKIYDRIGYLVILCHSCFGKMCDNINILQVKKVIFQKVFIIIVQKLELIHIIFTY